MCVPWANKGFIAWVHPKAIPLIRIATVAPIKRRSSAGV